MNNNKNILTQNRDFSAKSVVMFLSAYCIRSSGEILKLFCDWIRNKLHF